MPTYTFQCPQCEDPILLKMKFVDYESVKAGKKMLVCEGHDDVPMELIFNPGNIGFVLQDGPSGGWASKANKENNYRNRRAGVMRRREKDHVFKNRLVPNYGGEEAHSWKDVQDHARDQKGALSASTYDHLVKEQKT